MAKALKDYLDKNFYDRFLNLAADILPEFNLI